MVHTKDEGINAVLVKLHREKNCLKEMGNALNIFYRVVGPKHNIQDYIKLARNLKDSCERAMRELGSTAQCTANIEQATRARRKEEQRKNGGYWRKASKPQKSRNPPVTEGAGVSALNGLGNNVARIGRTQKGERRPNS